MESVPHSLGDPNWNRSFRCKLKRWYRAHARDLPWRKNGDPYRVWVSEVMLQQTQVATVGPYFERFISVFPTLQALAAGTESEVLRLWEGLGYYRRARQLHAAARAIVQYHRGEFPLETKALQSLPGIGRYTAGAILSIAFDRREPILEANTKRLLSRLLAFRGDPDSAAGQRILWSAAHRILPRKDVGMFNQAMMELGSEVCLATKPLCVDCPVRSDCAANLAGLQSAIPAAKKQTAYEEIREAAVVVRRNGKYLLMQYVQGERWAGLWDFPRFRLSDPPHDQNKRQDEVTTEAEQLSQGVASLTGIAVKPTKLLTTLRHGVTRYRITLECHEAHFLRKTGSNSCRTLAWCLPSQWDAYPCHSTGRKIRRLLSGDQG